MGRSAKLVKVKIGKHTYWSTSSGGKRAYFGNVKDVSRDEADKAFIAHRQTLLTDTPACPPEISVGDLCESYFDWAEDHVSDQNREMKKSCLSQWCDHKVGSGRTRYARIYGFGKLIGNLPATKITSDHLDDFIAARRQQVRLVGISAASLAGLKKRVSIGPAEGKVDLNSAIKARLKEIKGIGNNLAKR